MSFSFYSQSIDQKYIFYPALVWNDTSLLVGSESTEEGEAEQEDAAAESNSRSLRNDCAEALK